ncbi:cyclin-I-like [Diadema antillarum]|uniref:cyclin-I-like n=1 Tax=Diadema antillarum TaxID=105358 RepID=UPI003A8A15C4
MLDSSVKRVQLKELRTRLCSAINKEHQSWKPLLIKPPNNSEAEIGPSQRDEMVQWLLELNVKFRFCPETFMLSVTLLDHFLTAVKARPKYLRCIAITCFFLAAKMKEEDEMVPATQDFVRDSQCGCTVSEVLRMERVVLDKLKWELNFVNCLDFLQIFHAMLLSQRPTLLEDLHHMTPSRHLSMLTGRLSQCMTNHQLAAHRGSTLALAMLSLELEVLAADWLPLTIVLQRMVQVDSQWLIHCRELITFTLFGHSASHRMPSTRPVSPPDSASHQGDTSQKATANTAKRKKCELGENVYGAVKRLVDKETCDVALPSCPVPNPPAPGKNTVSPPGSCGKEVRTDGDDSVPVHPPLTSIPVT